MGSLERGAKEARVGEGAMKTKKPYPGIGLLASTTERQAATGTTLTVRRRIGPLTVNSTTPSTLANRV